MTWDRHKSSGSFKPIHAIQPIYNSSVLCWNFLTKIILICLLLPVCSTKGNLSCKNIFLQQQEILDLVVFVLFLPQLHQCLCEVITCCPMLSVICLSQITLNGTKHGRGTTVCLGNLQHFIWFLFYMYLEMKYGCWNSMLIYDMIYLIWSFVFS